MILWWLWWFLPSYSRQWTGSVDVLFLPVVHIVSHRLCICVSGLVQAFSFLHLEEWDCSKGGKRGMLESRTPAFLHRPDWNAKKAEVWLVKNAVSLMWLRMRERKKCVGRENDRAEYAWIFLCDCEHPRVVCVCVHVQNCACVVCVSDSALSFRVREIWLYQCVLVCVCML